MHDAALEAIEAKRDPKTRTVILVGLVSAILFVVLLMFLEVLYYNSVESERERKFVLVESEALRSMRAEQREEIGGYRTVDAENGVVAIPIERSMELLVAEGEPER